MRRGFKEGKAVLLPWKGRRYYLCGTVQVASGGQLVAIAEVDRGEIVPKRVFNLNGVTGRAGEDKKVGDDVDYDRA